jgi:hypothetical protein
VIFIAIALSLTTLGTCIELTSIGDQEYLKEEENMKALS